MPESLIDSGSPRARWKSTSQSILTKLDLPEAGGHHRRVLAVITLL
jgi:hypothetical protein